jgi:hypothetical protein
MKRWSLLHAGLIALTISLLIRQGQAQTFPNIPITSFPKEQSETAITVNPLNPNHLMVVWNDFKDAGTPQIAKKSKAGYAFSTDGGNNWSIIGVIPVDTLDGTEYTWGFDPSCAFDRSGNAYYCYVARKTDLSQDLGPVHLSKTNNNGTTWTHKRVSPSLVSQDKSFIAIDNTGGSYDGRIYVSWTDFANNQNKIKFAVSVDGGTTFPTVIDLETNAGFTPTPNAYAEPSTSTSSDPTIGPLVQGSVTAVAPNGDVYVAWLQADGGTGSTGTIQVYKGVSSQNSPYISFPGYPVIAASITVVWRRQIGWNRIMSWPTIAVDQNTGYIYVAWTELDAGDNLNVYYARSTNNGASFGPKAIASDPAYNSYAQFFPWLSVDPSGRVGLVFCDDRNDAAPSAAPPWIDVYFTESLDQGLSFSIPNLRITSGSSNANLATVTTDYQGLASTVGFFFSCLE